MKKQRLDSVIAALLGAVFVQLCFCSSAIAQQKWTANGDFKFQQSAANSGGTFTLQQTGTELHGSAKHWFSAVAAKELDESATNAHHTAGPVLGGQIVGDSFSLQIRYHEVFWRKEKLLNESIYIYEGTINTGGYVTGMVWEALNPGKKFGFIIETPLTKYVPPPPVPKPIKSSGKARPAAVNNSAPNANPAPWVNLIGKWATTTGNGKTFIMDLTQNGDLVEGKYDVVGAAPINGTMSGRIQADGKLIFNWAQYGDMKGTGIGMWQFDRSSNAFQGGYSAQTPVVANGPWTGSRASGDFVKPPAAQVFPMFPPGIAYQSQTARNEQLKQLNRLYNGKWVVKEKSSGTEFTISFAQNGNSVTGTFQPRNGKIDGTMASDGLLTYRWSDESGTGGAGIFAIYEGAALVGTYSKSQNPWEVSGQWAGGRQ